MLLDWEGIKNRIVDSVAAYQDEILAFTKELVAVPTENPPGNSYLACVEILADELNKIGLDPAIFEVPHARTSSGEALRQTGEVQPRYCLLSHYGSGTQTLYFHGHFDVVPAASQSQFDPYVQQGRLYGRGSSDMKSGLAAMIYAVKAIQDSDLQLDGRIGLTIVPDEETGGLLGSQYLARASLLGKDGIGMLLPEPTSGVLWNANRGALSMRVTVKGRPAHVGLHYQGINAFEQMLVVANALLELKAEVESRRTGYKIEPEAARGSILLLGGQAESGTNFNLVPGECSFTLDRRINPEEDLKQEKERLLGLFNRLRRTGIDLEVEILQEGLSAGSSQDDLLARTLAESVETISGRSPVFELCPGLLEIRFYAERGIPAFAYGPGLLSVSHGPDEYVQLEDVYRCTAVYALTAARMLAKSER